MRSLLVFFAILLAILTLISSLGGSLSTKETFYTEQPMEDTEGWQEATPEMPSEETPDTLEEESTQVAPPTMEGFESAPVDEVEPFEADDSMHATF
jgi:hypothetical protein